LDSGSKAELNWNNYVKKVIHVLEASGRPFLTSEDSQLTQEQLSLKYSAKKALILLTPISGQFPPLPLPTISFVSALLSSVAKYPRSIETVCASADVKGRSQC
jgi:hypothetical protein